jgi:hypothetical protein
VAFDRTALEAQMNAMQLLQEMDSETAYARRAIAQEKREEAKSGRGELKAPKSEALVGIGEFLRDTPVLNLLTTGLGTSIAKMGWGDKLTDQDRLWSALELSPLGGPARAGAGTPGMFIGPVGLGRSEIRRTTRPRFRQMERDGADPQDIWAETGIFRRTEGSLGAEIPDAALNPAVRKRLEEIQKDWNTRMASGEVPLEELLPDHAELFRLYPELKNTRVRFDEFSNNRGTFFPGSGNIEINTTRSVDQQYSTMLHETQHAVQDLEQRFGQAVSSGGSSSLFPNLSEASAYQAYLRIAGEAEARNTQRRFGKPGLQARHPFITMDVPVTQLLPRARTGEALEQFAPDDLLQTMLQRQIDFNRK